MIKNLSRKFMAMCIRKGGKDENSPNEMNVRQKRVKE